MKKEVKAEEKPQELTDAQVVDKLEKEIAELKVQGAMEVKALEEKHQKLMDSRDAELAENYVKKEDVHKLVLERAELLKDSKDALEAEKDLATLSNEDIMKAVLKAELGAELVDSLEITQVETAFKTLKAAKARITEDPTRVHALQDSLKGSNVEKSTETQTLEELRSSVNK